MEKTGNTLDTESQLLKLTRNKTKTILEKGNLDKIIRHKEALAKIVRAIEELKLQGEKAKIQEGVSLEDVQVWGADIEGEIDETDNEILYLSQYLQNVEMKSENENVKKKKFG